MTVKVHVHGVDKSFGTHQVLRDINITVDTHEVVCLIGSSGSGKSTILKCTNLLEPVDKGEILLDGVDITLRGTDRNSVRSKIGIVFQSFNLFPNKKVIDNITLAPRKVLKTDRAAAEANAHRLLQRFDLDDKADEYPDRLSGGQQQRVAIARALAMEPELMLFDEITSALDPELIAEVLDVIRDLKDAGMTIIMATHEMGFARDVADKVCFLDQGQILEEGTPEQIFGDPSQPRTQQFLRRVIDAGRL